MPAPFASSTSMHRPSRLALYAVVVTAVAAAASYTNARSDWRTASRESLGLAPDPVDVKEAVVQVYGARTVGAKGLFGVHTWVAVKPAQAQEWTVYEVVGWRLRWSQSAVVVQSRTPDARWFGAARVRTSDGSALLWSASAASVAASAAGPSSERTSSSTARRARPWTRDAAMVLLVRLRSMLLCGCG